MNQIRLSRELSFLRLSEGLVSSPSIDTTHHEVLTCLPADSLLVLHESLPPAGEGAVRTVTFFEGTLSLVASLLHPLVVVAAPVTNLSTEKY